MQSHLRKRRMLMMEYGCMVWLDHNHVQDFYESANNPNIDELNRRDLFLQRISQEVPYRMEGADIVVNIPDIDISALTSTPLDVYKQIYNMYMTFLPEQEVQKSINSYSFEPIMNIAA